MENNKNTTQHLYYHFYLHYRTTKKHRANIAKRRYERLDKERRRRRK
jgi:hypothetical protein